MAGTVQYLELISSINSYFQGEKLEALIFILPSGLSSVLFSLWLFTDNPGSFAKGVAIPFLVLGVLLSVVGGVVGFRTPTQVSEIMKSIETDPKAGAQAELKRMTKVNNAWLVYLSVWIFFGVAGLIMRFTVSSEFFQGIGIAMVFFAGVGLLIDGFAERRAQSYFDALSAVTVIQ